MVLARWWEGGRQARLVEGGVGSSGVSGGIGGGGEQAAEQAERNSGEPPPHGGERRLFVFAGRDGAEVAAKRRGQGRRERLRTKRGSMSRKFQTRNEHDTATSRDRAGRARNRGGKPRLSAGRRERSPL